MSDFYQIKGTEDKFYNEFQRIYSISFPLYEQRNNNQQVKAFNSIQYKLLCMVENDILLSFISYWDFDQYVYIEHLAVNEKYRGQNVGVKTLLKFKDLVKKTIVLEIDPMIDEISTKRFYFYQKIGFKLNEYRHTHPPYNLINKPHDLLILNTGDMPLSQNLYDTFSKDLIDIVMK